jgi:hypothetical protein
LVNGHAHPRIFFADEGKGEVRFYSTADRLTAHYITQLDKKKY